jgi:hypothetical protein
MLVISLHALDANQKPESNRGKMISQAIHLGIPLLLLASIPKPPQV